jgi:hypothetical protein
MSGRPEEYLLSMSGKPEKYLPVPVLSHVWSAWRVPVPTVHVWAARGVPPAHVEYLLAISGQTEEYIVSISGQTERSTRTFALSVSGQPK